MKIAIANDHAAVDMREPIIAKLKELGHTIIDFGSSNNDSVDYPDYGVQAARSVSEGKADRAVIMCGSGIGMCIVANKIQGIRCALCTDEFSARMSRMHNDANVLSLRAREMDINTNLKILEIWLTTKFEDGERHRRRIEKIHQIEKENCM